jgi:dihydrofolate reductase
MRPLAAITFLTLDGVMQSPSSPEEDPSNGFTGGGWAADYWEETMPQVMHEAMSEPYDILFGRKTYDIFAAHWPHVKDETPVARIMNNAKKYVVTSGQDKLDWDHSIPVSGNVEKEILHLKQQEGPLLQIHGSGQLIRSLLKHNLIDELRLWTFPVAVGAGKRLFDTNTTPRRFELVRTETNTNGVVMSIYQTRH